MWCQCRSQMKILYVHHIVTDWEVKNHNAVACSTSINESRSTGSVFGSGGHRQHDLFSLPFLSSL